MKTAVEHVGDSQPLRERENGSGGARLAARSYGTAFDHEAVLNGSAVNAVVRHPRSDLPSPPGLWPVSSEGDHSEAFRLTGAPKETITVSIELDASDQFERANPLATTMGTYPKLAAPFSKHWHLLFKSSQTTKTTINPREAIL
jgi:hypothetical protein